MSKQTAVEWLFEQLPFETRSSRYAFDALQQAKEMEKQQIIDDYVNGMYKGQEIYLGEDKIRLDVNHLVYSECLSTEYYNLIYKGGDNV
jgi:hypothetical protein